MEKESLNREYVTSRIIIFSIIIIIISVIGINILEVSVHNMEYIDRGMYTVITSKGPINITTDDVLRIERSFAKKPLSKNNIEIVKIYTKEGFIKLTSEDPYFNVAQQLINAVDYYGLTTWEHPGVDFKSIQPYSYTLGTPEHQVPILFLLFSCQYFALTIGGIALIILILPLRLNTAAD